MADLTKKVVMGGMESVSDADQAPQPGMRLKAVYFQETFLHVHQSILKCFERCGTADHDTKEG